MNTYANSLLSLTVGSAAANIYIHTTHTSNSTSVKNLELHWAYMTISSIAFQRTTFLGNGFQCLFEIGNNILDILNTDGHLEKRSVRGAVRQRKESHVLG
jgi:hypothetical protein